MAGEQRQGQRESSDVLQLPAAGTPPPDADAGTDQAEGPYPLQRSGALSLDTGRGPQQRERPLHARGTHAVLHRALKQAVKWSLVPRNVSEAVDPPKLVSEEVAALLPEEARTFLDATRGDRFEALYVVAVSAGLRRGELLGLRWTDMELDRVATLRVGRQLQRMRDGSGLRFMAPKGGKGRTIRLPAHTVEALKAHRARQAEEKLKAGP